MRAAKICTFLTIAAFLLLGLSNHTGAAGYKEIDVASGGTITGKFTFEGELPVDAIEQIAITKNPDVCGQGYREVIWVDVKDGALRGAFAYIDKIKEGKKWVAPEGGSYLVLQKGCRFRPWAQVVKRGPITIRNDDPGVLHNINTRELIGVEKGRVVKRTMFNFGQPDPGDIEQELKPRRASFIAINCEAHNFMFGFMMAPKHPYAVVVNEDGSYALNDVPPGTYTLKAWHPRFGIQKTKVTVPEGGEVKADFAFSP
ncbi:MAG TPA: carboxypeptidase regulatory-like domain-containing protein [Alphaproteobacteria bacterium]|jgi:hypothetical protein|nr:carboxypeptidase regulatory-like domain-containing protein [Alphaproteobacteria bacterium]HJN60176.1 carboxypeptidase regulatory-like domain-containing protein [Alphaproteobacteria bacterium]